MASLKWPLCPLRSGVEINSYSQLSMSIMDDMDLQLDKLDKVCIENNAKLHADWGSYSINILADNTVRVFSNNIQAGFPELHSIPEILKDISEDVGIECDPAMNELETAGKIIAHINSMSRPKVIRCIHPVGQGAMYSERFLDNEYNTVFLAVYDCGSTSPQKLKREVSSSFTDRDDIDLLFISHLDSDHVCGIKRLKESVNSIRNVVLPLLPDSVKNTYLLLADKVLTQIIGSPETFFPNANIIYVRSVSENKDDSTSLTLPLVGDKVREIESGTVISPKSSLILDWGYIPYNYDENTRINAFKNELSLKRIQESQLNDPKFIAEHRTLLAGIYKKVCGNSVNDSSLVVYSGGINSQYPSKYIHTSVGHLRCSTEASLYLGDADLNQTSINSAAISVDLKNRLDLKDLNKHIGSIQLPHHGSVKNFHLDLLSYGTVPKVYFASFGMANSYGHPSSAVKGIIAANNECFCSVTDNRSSALIQIIQL